MEINKKLLSENTHGQQPTSPDVPLNEPCAYVNPILWLYFCRVTKRDPWTLWNFKMFWIKLKKFPQSLLQYEIISVYSKTSADELTTPEVNMSNTASLANDYAALDAQIKELTKKRDAIKAEIIATGEKSIVGDLAEVTVSESYPTTFSKDLAQTLLSDVDFKRCFATTIKPTISLRVKALAKAYA